MDKLYQSNIVGPIKRAEILVAPEMELIVIIEIRKRRDTILPISQKKFGTIWRPRSENIILNHQRRSGEVNRAMEVSMTVKDPQMIIKISKKIKIWVLQLKRKNQK